jgi:xanthine dehydrogenase accessory factor
VREIFATVADWLESGVSLALGTLVETFDSSPAPVGTTVAVDAQGRIAGNVGAGCHESEIVDACRQTIDDAAFRLLRINLDDDDEITGGAGCGGALKIAVWKPGTDFASEARTIARGARTHELRINSFTVMYPAKRRLVLVGATTLAQEVARLAKMLDFFVTVIDPRPVFATRERLPDVDVLVLEWPDDVLDHLLERASAIVVLSHDPKFDVPALESALRSNVPYVGLLGSRRSQAARRDALRERGVDEALFARIRGPVGLDLGGETTVETALSILAQIVAESHSRKGGSLDRSDAAIHAGCVKQ